MVLSEGKLENGTILWLLCTPSRTHYMLVMFFTCIQKASNGERDNDSETGEIRTEKECKQAPEKKNTHTQNIPCGNKQTIQLNCKIVFVLFAVDNLSTFLTFLCVGRRFIQFLARFSRTFHRLPAPFRFHHSFHCFSIRLK